MSDADSIARARDYGERGARLPADMRGDPAYEAAHQEGRTARTLARRGDSARTSEHPLLPRRPVSHPARASSPSGSPARPAATRPARPARRGRPGYFSRAFSPSAAANRAGLGKAAGAGDAGGLLLALVVYPLFLSVVKYGSTGPGMWFRAKWLNQTADTGAVGKIQGPIIGKGTGPRQRGGGGAGVPKKLPQ